MNCFFDSVRVLGTSAISRLQPMNDATMFQSV